MIRLIAGQHAPILTGRRTEPDRPTCAIMKKCTKKAVELCPRQRYCSVLGIIKIQQEILVVTDHYGIGACRSAACGDSGFGSGTFYLLPVLRVPARHDKRIGDIGVLPRLGGLPC